MSEWLTTGQMIDKLEVGEVAESNFGEKVFISKGGSIKKNDMNTQVMLTKATLSRKWRILPKYVTFEEAMQALKDGKTVKIHFGDGIMYFGQYDTEPESISFKEMLEGKWSIVE